MARKTKTEPKNVKSGRRRLPRQDRARATIDALVESTERCLAQYGYAGTSTNRIAKVAGTGIASLYEYFEDKDALLAEAARRRLQQDGQVILSLLTESTTTEQAIREAVRYMMRRSHDEPELVRSFLLHAPTTDALEVSTEIDRLATAALTGFLRVREPTLADPDMAAFTLVRTVRYGTLCYGRDQPSHIDAEAFGEALVAMAIGWLATQRR